MSSLPSYVAAAKPVPAAGRIPWYKGIAPTYAGIMLWFVFWHGLPVGPGLSGDHPEYSAVAGGTLAQGLGIAVLGVVIAALLCHFLFYLVPGRLGVKTGLPLYIVGTSTYGVTGGLLMPGLLMGLLQFGWVAVNAFFTSVLLVAPFGAAAGSVAHVIVAAVFVIAAVLVGMMGLQYVARVATFLPLIPLFILLVLGVLKIGSVGQFDSAAMVKASEAVQFAAPQATAEGAANAPPSEVKSLHAGAPLSTFGVIECLVTIIVGFFATAGAAGVDISMSSRSERDAQIGGLVGVAGATIFAGALALLFVAGVYGAGGLNAADAGKLQATALMQYAVGAKAAPVFMYLLAIAAFPPACVSAFIAATSFKTTLPQVNPFVSVGIGAVVAIILAATGVAGNAAGVFTVIGASFGPICGAMAADYLMAGRQWAGPRAGFNPAGWISWIVGFAIGAVEFIATIPGLEMLSGKVPAPPVAAFIVGFVLYYLLALAGLQSRSLEMPPASK